MNISSHLHERFAFPNDGPSDLSKPSKCVVRNCFFGPKLLGTVCLDAWCKSRYTVTIRKQMVFKPTKTGDVVFGYSLGLLFQSRCHRDFFWLLALLVRWKICRRVVQILCLHGCPCLPDGHLADFLWGGVVEKGLGF